MSMSNDIEGICPIRKEDDLAVVLSNHSYCSLEGCESAWFNIGCSLKSVCKEYERMKGGD